MSHRSAPRFPRALVSVSPRARCARRVPPALAVIAWLFVSHAWLFSGAVAAQDDAPGEDVKAADASPPATESAAPQESAASQESVAPQESERSLLASLDGESLAGPLRALLAVTIFGVVPSAVLLTTCFPRILVVLCFLRRAIGAQDLPPNSVVFGLSLLLTGAVMLPVWSEVYEKAYVPLVEERSIDAEEAYRRAEVPVKRFLLDHTLRDDLLLMLEIHRADRPPSADPGSTDARRLEDLSLLTILPAFVLSELKLAFQIGFLLFLPFLLIDLLVSAGLVSMGMIMLPPALVSLPLKILVFVLVDGWSLLVSQLVLGIRTAGV